MTRVDPLTVDEVLAAIPAEVYNDHGGIFGSGRDAWCRNDAPEIYFLGENPGGRLEDHPDEFVGPSAENTLRNRSPRWASIVDNQWGPRAEHGRRKVRGLMDALALDPHLVPISNVVFTRSPATSDLGHFPTAAARCWPFHAAIIDRLQPRFVVCMGKKAADYVSRQAPGPTVIAIPHYNVRPRMTDPAWVARVSPLIESARETTT